MYAWVTWVSMCSVNWREGEGGERKRKKVRECEFSFRSEVRKKNGAHTGPGARWATHL